MTTLAEDRVYFSILWLAMTMLVATEEWLHCTTLDSDDKYHVCWNIISRNSSDEIEFKLEVETLGYVGFGLSPNGGMKGSDIVIGWIRDGKVYFQDRHAEGESTPEIDSSADWHLISGNETDTRTVLTFRRKLDTCDKEDMKIDDSTMKLIYAYWDKDPVTENDIKYHRKNRGSKSVLLLQKGTRNIPVLDKSDLSYWDILSPNFTIESTFESKYWCKIYKAPVLNETNHVISIEPLIQKGSEGFVHHMLLYECIGAAPHEYEPHVEHEGWECRHANMPDAMRSCEGIFYAWAVGGDSLVFPEHVGIPLAGKSDKYFLLEMHYDNQFKKGGIIDSSGLRIYYTPETRKYEAGTIMIGSTVSARTIIPPGRTDYVVAGHSNPDCTDPEIPEGGLKLLGALLHAHLLGRHLEARHFRGNQELTPLADDSNYDFNYQDYRYFSEEISFLRGDQITVECTYDSSERNETTLGGEKTREEMCIVFLLYYPRIARYASVSVPKLNVINKALQKNYTLQDMLSGEFRADLEFFNWDSVDTHEVERILRFEAHDTHCYLGNGTKNSVKSFSSYPKNLLAYQQPTQCLYMYNKEIEQTATSGCENHQCRLFILFTSFLAALLFNTEMYTLR